jgi:hypothetical protein
MGQTILLLDLDTLGFPCSLDGVVVLPRKPSSVYFKPLVVPRDRSNLVIADGHGVVHHVANRLDLLLESSLLLGSRVIEALLLLLKLGLLR